jgi:hypothetical protein
MPPPKSAKQQMIEEDEDVVDYVKISGNVPSNVNPQSAKPPGKRSFMERMFPELKMNPLDPKNWHADSRRSGSVDTPFIKLGTTRTSRHGGTRRKHLTKKHMTKKHLTKKHLTKKHLTKKHLTKKHMTKKHMTKK